MYDNASLAFTFKIAFFVAVGNVIHSNLLWGFLRSNSTIDWNDVQSQQQLIINRIAGNTINYCNNLSVFCGSSAFISLVHFIVLR